MDEEIVKVEDIKDKVYEIRGVQVMLDTDLAALYGYEVKRLNEQVKRNINRFPSDFMFQLTQEEKDYLWSQFATANINTMARSLPYVFTEQGIYMLATVLKGELAEQQSIFIMRAFKEMRNFISNNNYLIERVNSIEIKQIEYQKESNIKFNQIFKYMLNHEESSQKVFFEGQIYDAFSLIASLISKAKRNIILIDGYVDTGTLDCLRKKNKDVDIDVYTSKRGCRFTNKDIETFNGQYPILNVYFNSTFHDRFLIIDNEIGYHVGASIKDAGKKCFAITRIEDTEIVKEIIEKVGEGEG